MKISKLKLIKLIREVLSPDLPMKLRVLDFDDTIAHTGEMVKLYTPEGPNDYEMLTSDQYAVYIPQGSEYFDESSFEEFSRVDSSKATPVSPVFRILGNFVRAQEGNRVILILTARKQEVEDDVRAFLRDNKMDDTNIAFVGVGSSDPMAKVEVIARYISSTGASFVSFFDDSIKNVTAVKEYLDSLPISNDVAHIDKQGDRIVLDRYFMDKGVY